MSERERQKEREWEKERSIECVKERQRMEAAVDAYKVIEINEKQF